MDLNEQFRNMDSKQKVWHINRLGATEMNQLFSLLEKDVRVSIFYAYANLARRYSFVGYLNEENIRASLLTPS